MEQDEGLRKDVVWHFTLMNNINMRESKDANVSRKGRG